MQRLFDRPRPAGVLATRADGEIFPESVQRLLLNDLPAVEFHALNTGHFALEDHAPEIAELVRNFLDR